MVADTNLDSGIWQVIVVERWEENSRLLRDLET